MAGSLPRRLTLYGSVGVLFGYPTQAGSHPFTVTATKCSNCTGSKQYSLKIGGAALRSLAFGDFGWDGKADLSVWRGKEGDWMMVASGDGQMKTETWGLSAAPHFDLLTPGDYDGDGKMGLTVFPHTHAVMPAQQCYFEPIASQTLYFLEALIMLS